MDAHPGHLDRPQMLIDSNPCPKYHQSLGYSQRVMPHSWPAWIRCFSLMAGYGCLVPTPETKSLSSKTPSSKQQSSELFPSYHFISRINIHSSIYVCSFTSLFKLRLGHLWNRPKIPNSSALEWRSHRRPRRATRPATRPWERRKLSR